MNFSPNHLRRQIVTMAYRGQTVHVPCAFSIVEVLSVLYSKFLRFSKDPKDATRDRLILSKGHGVMALYACLNELGHITPTDLDQYFKDGSRLHGLCEAKIPGGEVTSGSLGHGLPIATGIALGLKWRGSDSQVYCVVGDGEMNEGPMWEALLFANQHKLRNLSVIVDVNKFQAMGTTESILSLEPLREKFESFGFEALECDGHDVAALEKSFSMLRSSDSSRPKALIARTEKGQGVSFMRGDNTWHYTRLTDDTYRRALAELADHA